ncbi:hypothetical protein D3C71_2005610 [compost metagenome]
MPAPLLGQPEANGNGFDLDDEFVQVMGLGHIGGNAKAPQLLKLGSPDTVRPKQ